MRRFMAFVACFIVALNCVGNALGETPQRILSPEFAWLWWFVSASWLLIGFTILVRGLK